jgi:hypothetical protein
MALACETCGACRFWAGDVTQPGLSVGGVPKWGWCVSAEEGPDPRHPRVSGHHRKGNTGLETRRDSTCSRFVPAGK